MHGSVHTTAVSTRTQKRHFKRHFLELTLASCTFISSSTFLRQNARVQFAAYFCRQNPNQQCQSN